MAELERQRVATAQAATTARRFESCCLRLSDSGVVELERRAVVTRESAGSIPAAGAFARPRGRSGDDAGPSTRKLRVRAPTEGADDQRRAGRPRGKGSTPVPRGRRRGSRPGSPTSIAVDSTRVTTFVSWLWGSWPPHRPWKPGIAGSSPASQTLRGRGAVVLASLMSSRPWVRIPPARLDGGVAQTARALACQARGRRFEPGRPRCGRGVAASIRGRDPRGAGSSPAGHPFPRTLSIGELTGL
jgi:hypothetical protein